MKNLNIYLVSWSCLQNGIPQSSQWMSNCSASKGSTFYVEDHIHYQLEIRSLIKIY